MQIRTLSIGPDVSLTLINEVGTWRFSGWSRHTFTELAAPAAADRAQRFATIDAAAAHFRRLHPAEASGPPRTRSLRLLGESRIADTRFAFYRVGAVHDVVLTRGGDGAKTYRVADGGRSLPSLQRIASRLLRAHSWKAVDDSADEPLKMRILANNGGNEQRVELWRADARLGELRIGQRGRYVESLLAWSFDARPTVAEARSPLHRAVLDLVARYIVGETPTSPPEFPPEAWRQLYVDLAGERPRRDAESITSAAAASPLRVAVSVPTRCHQACVFCAAPLQPPQERVLGAFDVHVEKLTEYLRELLPSCERDGLPLEFVLVGDDAFSHPRLDAMLALLDRPAVRSVRILGPASTLANDGVAAALTRHRNCRGVILTLLGPDAAVHDHVAGRRGAFVELGRAIAQCRSAGLEVELNSILTPHNAAHLGATLDLVRALDLSVCLYLFTTEPMTNPTQARTCAMSPGVARSAIEAAGAERFRVVQRINHAPLCYVPPWARVRAAAGVDQWFPDRPASLPAGCVDCRLRQAGCAGPTRGLIEAVGPEVFVGE